MLSAGAPRLLAAIHVVPSVELRVLPIACKTGGRKALAFWCPARANRVRVSPLNRHRWSGVRASSSSSSSPPSPSAVSNSGSPRKTCRQCKKQFTDQENHPRSCRHHTAHFGGETKRKFEGVYTGGTMSTVGGGEVTEYWHCCGSEDPFDIGCEASPHKSYDD